MENTVDNGVDPRAGRGNSAILDNEQQANIAGLLKSCEASYHSGRLGSDLTLNNETSCDGFVTSLNVPSLSGPDGSLREESGDVVQNRLVSVATYAADLDSKTEQFTTSADVFCDAEFLPFFSVAKSVSDTSRDVVCETVAVSVSSSDLPCSVARPDIMQTANGQADRVPLCSVTDMTSNVSQNVDNGLLQKCTLLQTSKQTDLDKRTGTDNGTTFGSSSVICGGSLALNLPLEVIGACWFMRRDTETCLQAVTANNEKILIRLSKKDSRVSLIFDAAPGCSAFEFVRNGCHCHVETLVEPLCRPSPVSMTALQTGCPLKLRHDIAKKSTAALLPTSAAAESAPSVTSRLRVRLSTGIHYEDDEEEDEEEEEEDEEDDDEEVDDEEAGNGQLDEIDDEDDDNDDEDFDFGDEGEEEEDGEEEEEEKSTARIKSIKIAPVVKRKTRSSRVSSDEGDEWTPKYRTRSKQQSHTSIRLKVKIKDEPKPEEVMVGFEEDEYRTEDDLDTATDIGSQPKKKKWHKRVSSSNKLEIVKPKSHHKKKSLDSLSDAKVRRHRSKDGPKWEKKGVCPHCGVFYGNLGQHVGLYCPKNPDRQRAYHCCYCKFRSLDRASLVEHKATHILARDFKCEICDSSFYTRQRLVRHMRYVHLLGSNPVRIYTCDRCGKRFRYHSHYDRHLTIHSEEKSAQCDKCGKFFKNSHNVRNHQSRMHPGKPEPYPFYCEKCGQGTHSLTAHRCITPGEMHGSRRRRAPRNSALHTANTKKSASTAVTAAAATGCASVEPVENNQPTNNVSVSSPPSNGNDSPMTSHSVASHSQTVEPLTRLRMSSPQLVDCRCSSSAQVALDCGTGRPSSAAEAATDAGGSAANAAGSEQHAVDRRPVANVCQPVDRYSMSLVSSQPSFDPHSATAAHLVSTIGRSPYHHHTHHHHQGALSGSELTYDRRVASNFEHSHLPAMAHQPPQQPPYSNLFAVDPLLQLRAANMMYRMDY